MTFTEWWCLEWFGVGLKVYPMSVNVYLFEVSNPLGFVFLQHFAIFRDLLFLDVDSDVF